MIASRNPTMPLLLKYLADSYTTCFMNSKLRRRERLKSASLDNRHLTLLLAFLGCIRMNCVKTQTKVTTQPVKKRNYKKRNYKKRNCRNELIRQFTVKSRKMLRVRKGKRDQVVGICVSEHQHLVIQESIEFSKTIT